MVSGKECLLRPEEPLLTGEEEKAGNVWLSNGMTFGVLPLIIND
jgi:hypothetical protein